MEVKPIQSAPSSDSSGRKNDDVEDQVDSPSMKLGVGIGGAAVIKQEKSMLTAAQLDELQRQVVIYKYIAGGLPVPAALVRPVVDSLPVANGVSGIHRRYPSFVGFKEFDYRKMMDPEPERCRRTDGKRWRCRKDVVPGQKYCEQHMHRGRRRSRKPVESSQMIITSNATPPNFSSEKLENSNGNSFCSAPENIPSDTGRSHKNSVASIGNVDFKIMGTKMTVGVVSVSKSMSTGMTQKGTAECVKAAAIPHTYPTDTTVTIASVGTNEGDNNNYRRNHIDGMNGNCSKYVSLKDQIDSSSMSADKKIANAASSQGLNFLPKTLLQVQGSNSACLYRSEAELEPRRCRRTDGKKWRCRRDVVPNEKYCKMHMHRGAKKRVVDYQPTPTAAPATTRTSHLNPMSILPKNADSTKLNTNLSISISTSPQLPSMDNMNTSDATVSSGSDTTISDTVITTCEDRDISS